MLDYWDISKHHEIAGWWLTYPSEKYEWKSDGMMIIPNIWKVIIQHAPNHQADMVD